MPKASTGRAPPGKVKAAVPAAPAHKQTKAAGKTISVMSAKPKMALCPENLPPPTDSIREGQGPDSEEVGRPGSHRGHGEDGCCFKGRIPHQNSRAIRYVETGEVLEIIVPTDFKTEEPA